MVLFMEVVTVLNVLSLIGTGYLACENIRMLNKLHFQEQQQQTKEENKLELLKMEYDRRRLEAPKIAHVVYKEDE